MNEKRKTLSVSKAAEYLGCSRGYAYRLYECGKLEGYRLGERQGIKIYCDSVQEYRLSREGL